MLGVRRGHKQSSMRWFQLFRSIPKIYILQTFGCTVELSIFPFPFRTVHVVGDTGLSFDNDTTSCANGVTGRVLQVDQSAACTQAVGTTCDWTGLETNYDYSVKIKIYQCKQMGYT